MREKFSNGFTIIEVLASLSLILVVGAVIGSILLSSTRGATKAGNLAIVRQNGNFALSQIEKTIRNGTTLSSSCSASSSTVSVTNQDGTTSTILCSAGNITIQNITDALPIPTPAPLLDVNAVQITSPASCNIFSCVSGGVGNYPTITTSFSLDKNSTSAFFENHAPITFQSSVTIRNQIQ